MAQWGLAKNGRTTPRLYARTPALQPNNVILVLRTPLSGPFLECGPFFGIKRTVVANLTDGNEVSPTSSSSSSSGS